MTVPVDLDPRTPVLVGIGLVEQREDDPTVALDAFGLMLAAARAAATDAARPELVRQIDLVAVPAGSGATATPVAISPPLWAATG